MLDMAYETEVAQLLTTGRDCECNWLAGSQPSESCSQDTVLESRKHAEPSQYATGASPIPCFDLSL